MGVPSQPAFQRQPCLRPLRLDHREGTPLSLALPGRSTGFKHCSHGGHLGLTANEESHATWFIAAWLLRPVLRWFSQHPAADLTDLDDEIAALPTAPWPPESMPSFSWRVEVVLFLLRALLPS